MSLLEMALSSCTGGFAGEYPCQGIDFMSRVPLSSFTGSPLSASNLWGYVDLDDNREYAIIGLRNGTGVVDITDPVNPVIVGHIAGVSSQWREVKVYQFRNTSMNRWDAYAYITTEGSGGGIQIIDLTQLPASVSLAGTWTGVSTSHTDHVSNINYSTNASNNPNFPPILYISGSNKGGLRFVSLANPTNLTEIGFWTGTYSHDTYAHVFTDARANQCAPGHNPCEVVFSFAGTPGLKIIDVTNKSAPVTLSTFTYPQLGYTHSGWISSDGNYIYLHDELDEQNFGVNGRIYTIDITNLTAPFVSNIYSTGNAAIDHNGYTIGNKFYYSNYTRGIGILDVTNPNAPVELSYFDTFPTNNNVGFDGAWGVYPYLPSGNIIISDIQRGLIVVKEQSGGGGPTPNSNGDEYTHQYSNKYPTATATPSRTNTPTPTNTPSVGNTGWLGPTTNAAQTSSAGDNNGYESSDKCLCRWRIRSRRYEQWHEQEYILHGPGKDKHLFYNYNFYFAASQSGNRSAPRSARRLQRWIAQICVEIHGTEAHLGPFKNTPNITTTQGTYILGGLADTWGRTWAVGDFTNANFRIRVTDVSNNANRDFFLDWIAVE